MLENVILLTENSQHVTNCNV